MYLYHFGFRKLPFSLTPDTDLFCALPVYQEALNTLNFALSTGEAFCKVTGEVGSGKTLLCRLLLNKISEQRTVAYIPNPVLKPKELKLALAHELNMRVKGDVGEELLIPKLQKKLIDEFKKRGPVILVIDEAQAMPDETLETLRLFANLETEQAKLLQIVLLGQPELNEKLAQEHLRQLRQRIVFSYHLKPLNRKQIRQYVQHRVAHVTTGNGVVFSHLALRAISYFSRGVPRLVNILSHKSLMLAFGKGEHRIGLKHILVATKDTDDTSKNFEKAKHIMSLLLLMLFSSTAVAWWIAP
ncbi:ExeA family protein [Pleionea sp. CnH1-48]|uniref:ExeA family protein n=1 Tax=Pleionea sp. CnH1-48 TaxID=2954494 RepID=UPI0020980D9E|nr:AAA family ATPase [Pleionea sp. CnH1-48]MCO7226310.1 AAA family ATPase [Pleionea sp. CnH1-48]